MSVGLYGSSPGLYGWHSRVLRPRPLYARPARVRGGDPSGREVYGRRSGRVGAAAGRYGLLRRRSRLTPGQVRRDDDHLPAETDSTDEHAARRLRELRLAHAGG